MPSALVILAEGAEEIEFVGTVDVLRRAGITVTVGGLAGIEPVKCSRDVVVVPDVSLSSVDKSSFDVVILPGGLGGSVAMSESTLVGEILKHQETSDKLIAAICAAPMALQAHSIGFGKTITSYPSFKDKLTGNYKNSENAVEQDGKLITSRGPATFWAFALKISENLVGIEKTKQVSAGLLI
ncbi:unnamed protein product [Diamesa serratosioi]